MQILPAIDLRHGKCVRLQQGDYARQTVFSEDPVATARRWARAGAERLHLVDLDGAKAGRPVNHDSVRAIVQAVGVPCQLGGGIRDEAAIRLALDDLGVERVIVGTQALRQPDWFREICRRFPRCVCLGLDARDARVATEGWLQVSEVSALELARGYADLDLPAVIYTDIARDGMLQGVGEGTLAELLQLAELGLPVIASGGVTTLEDVRRLAEVSRLQPRLVGAIIGRALYEGAIDLAEAVRIARGPSPPTGLPPRPVE